jgi:hypothetical protein
MRKHIPLPSLEDLNYSFYLDPQAPSGLRWKNPKRGRMKPGQTAGSIMPNGYWQVRLSPKTYLCSRIVYKMYNNGADPGEFEVDHYDRNKNNNAGSNLVLATQADQQANRDVFGVIPYRNVYIDKCSPAGKVYYVSSVRYRHNHKRKSVVIGRFTNPYEASLAALIYKRTNGKRWEYAPAGTK